MALGSFLLHAKEMWMGIDLPPGICEGLGQE